MIGDVAKTNPKLRLALLWMGLFAFILVPFALFGTRIDEWFAAYSTSSLSKIAITLLCAGLLIADIAIPVPSTVVIAFAGSQLGITSATIVCATALSIGHYCGYVAGLGGQGFVYGSHDKNKNQTSLGMILLLAITRPVPVLAESMSVQAGLSSLSLPQFLLGIIPANIALCFIMAAASSSIFMDANMLLALTFIIFALLFVFSIVKWCKKRV